jgi:hypothetical protein
LGIAHLAKVLAMPVNRMMAGKTAARSVGPREPAAMVAAAVVPATKVRVTVGMPAAVAAAMTPSMPASMASAALADRRTG